MAEETPLSIHVPNGERGERGERGAVEGQRGIVVVQEAFGVNDHIEDVTRRFADEGWLAVAPHLFHRTGDPKLGYGDLSQVMPHMVALTPEAVLADIDAALAALAANGVDPAQTGVVGFCMGGTVALITAARRDVGAAVSFYGGGVAEGRFGFPSLIELAPSLRAPWLGLYADLDTGIPVEDVEKLRAAAAESGQITDVVRYPEAGHGFHCDLRESYHPASAADAWSRTLAWFNRFLVN